MALELPVDTQINIGTLEAGPFTIIAYTRTYNFAHDRNRPDKIVFFGGAQHVPPGKMTDTLSITGGLDLADTAGQNVIRSAYQNDTEIFAEVVNGTSSRVFGCKVSNYNDSADSDGGDYVEFNFELEATTEVTVGA